MKYLIDVFQAKPGTKYIYLPYRNAEKLFDFGRHYEKAKAAMPVEAGSQEEALEAAFAELSASPWIRRPADISDIFIISDGLAATAFYRDGTSWTDVSERVFKSLFQEPGQAERGGDGKNK
ncbi:MAG: hypothetical protein NC131_21955 [Roseburia sp.]|nr:hypothetical protein [Roseburia sp.]